MIAEPYICTRGTKNLGKIAWVTEDRILAPDNGINFEGWTLYADFEREKLEQIGCRGKKVIRVEDSWGYHVTIKKNGVERTYESDELIEYNTGKYWDDSESGRVLNRARFLKAVCEKEGVEWFPWSEEKTQLRRRAEKAMKQVNDMAAELLGDQCPKSCPHKNAIDPEACICCRRSDLPERDTYTKDEVDALIRGVKRTAEIAAHMCWYGELKFRTALFGFLAWWLPDIVVVREKLEDLRHRFLSTPNKLDEEDSPDPRA